MHKSLKSTALIFTKILHFVMNFMKLALFVVSLGFIEHEMRKCKRCKEWLTFLIPLGLGDTINIFNYVAINHHHWCQLAFYYNAFYKIIHTYTYMFICVLTYVCTDTYIHTYTYLLSKQEHNAI